METRRFVLEQSGDTLTSLAGLTLAGLVLHQFAWVVS